MTVRIAVPVHAGTAAATAGSAIVAPAAGSAVVVSAEGPAALAPPAAGACGTEAKVASRLGRQTPYPA